MGSGVPARHCNPEFLLPLIFLILLDRADRGFPSSPLSGILFFRKRQYPHDRGPSPPSTNCRDSFVTQHRSATPMPQFDPTTFLPQLFWLAVTFAVLFFVISRHALPRLSSIMEARQQRINTDLDKAASIKKEAEQVLAEYERALGEAIAAQAVTVVAAPIVAGALWWLTNRHDNMGADRNGLVINVFALIGFVLLLAMAAYTATYKVWPEVAKWIGVTV